MTKHGDKVLYRTSFMHDPYISRADGIDRMDTAEANSTNSEFAKETAADKARPANRAD